MSPLLNLSNADESEATFIPLTPGPYEATIQEAKWEETSGTGKLPAGTPMLNIQFKITDAKLESEKERKDKKANELVSDRVFDRYIIPPDKVDGKPYQHKAMMEGQLVRFLLAVGYDSDEVKSGKFELDVEDLAGREAVVILGVESYVSNEIGEDGEPVAKKRNTVKGVKKIGTVNTGSASGGKGLI